MTLDPPRLDRDPAEVTRSLRGDPRLMKKLSNYGPPVHIFTVRWQHRDAGIAIVDTSVVLAAAGLTGGVAVGQYGHSALTLTGGRTARLRLFGETHAVTFRSGEEAAFCQEGIAARNRKRRIELGDVEPLELADDERLVRRCTYVGGAYLPLPHQSLVDLVFRTDALEIYRSPCSPESDVVAAVPFSPKFSLDVGGPGRVTQGGGFVIITGEGEPGEVRRHLSPVFVRLRQEPSVLETAPPPPAGQVTDLVSQIERLAALHRAGVLTGAEFAAAKAALLRGN